MRVSAFTISVNITQDFLRKQKHLSSSKDSVTYLVQDPKERKLRGRHEGQWGADRLPLSEFTKINTQNQSSFYKITTFGGMVNFDSQL